MLLAFMNRITQYDHKQFGHFFGMIIGAGIGIYSLPYLSALSLPFIGTLSTFPLLLIKIIAVPFVSGTFANIFSNLGSGIDLITNRKTIIHLVRHANKKLH
jgi:hypothetical protein